ncbi:flagellar biosynthesis protein FlhB [Marinobacterium arenosum]|uniref:flagellar biosynthesis protein FlhB n=1 Tax=Marinobacterium arenosum TaxID=2862496 RepID=UPI001C9641B2|nr:flagellar biosynthesis protein FlhB [Marinobacterium arenosum]MBY4675958.1 flagellar type III secretion system protein FlhB [Marinobacterium arenosum]
MAENEDGQEKTEEPTPKRLQDAREKGDVPRSRELGTMAVLMASVAAALVFGNYLVHLMAGMLRYNFSLDRDAVFDVKMMFEHLGSSLFDGLLGIGGFFGLVLLAALISPIALGGWIFSGQALAPKLNRINPLSGLKRMFSVKALVELAKALAKFLLVGTFGVFSLWMIKDDLLALGSSDIRTAMGDAVELVMWVFLVMSLSLILIAAIDVPYQIYEYTKKLKMTLQEIKDEMKNTEGKPEVKGRIRQLQREIAQRNMMGAVPEADVVITNPTHYSVALKYDTSVSDAPIMVAKGADFVALKIREVAREHEVPILTAPPLARAIYYSTEIGEQIPDGLFMAVAQVLAYVYQLRRYKSYQDSKPTPPGDADLDIPHDLRRDD